VENQSGGSDAARTLSTVHEWQDRLAFSRRRGPPVYLQSEAAECGLACLAMIAAWHGFVTDLPSLRRRFAVSLAGSTLKHLIDMAGQLNLSGRPLRLELHELADLKTPCVLHWDLNHFVVLKRTGRNHISIIDPACGERRIPFDEASRHFTGVALELTPTSSFRSRDERRTVPLRSFLGRVDGLRKSFVQILLLALSLEVAAIASPLFMQWVVDGAVVSADRDLLLLLALGFSLLMVIQAAISLARSWVVLFVSTHLGLQWSSSVLAHLLRLPMTWFERRHMGDIVSRFSAVAAIQRTLTTSFLEAVIDGLLAIAMLLLMLFYSAALASIVLGSVLLYGLLRWTAYRPLRTATEEQVVLNARANSVFMESVRGVSSVKLFNGEEDRRNRWMNATVDATNRGLLTEKMTLSYRLAQSLLFGTENVLVVYLGAIAVMENALSVGMLFAFVSYKTTFSGRVAALIDKWVQLGMIRLQAERLSDIVLAEPEPESAGDRPAAPQDAALEAHGVSFRYGDSDPWVLQRVSITVRPGECVALTGGSGCGKTTLLKILLGLLPPTEGEVRFGGVPLGRFGLRAYRRMVAAVMQDDQLLSGSIAENIAFFDPLADVARISESARMASVHDEVSAMPMGYATLIGDMGSSLSGGQKQRILLARAFYKQPRALFLDEATSHLDVPREREVNAAVRTIGCTCVLVAHRPETIASADRVVVLDGGMVVQDFRRTGAAGPERPAARQAPPLDVPADRCEAKRPA
jgi:ATP-binding cassette, subfamily B, bacterial CvaB/MchF/RaxB